MSYFMLGDWLLDAISWLFIKLLDGVAYSILSLTYNIFYQMSKINLFGADSLGQALYDSISARLYTVLSIVMVFVFAYQLIMLIINPDGGKDKQAGSKLVKDTVISVVAIVLLPTVYKYMALFQNHVLEENTIGALVLGMGSGTSGNAGKTIALMTNMAFYHPEGTSYNTFFDENGNIKDSAQSDCESQVTAASGSGHTGVCSTYVTALEQWKMSAKSGISSITGKKALYQKTDDEGMYYIWILSTIAALGAAYYFVMYTISIGKRAVKLGALQLITPIPLVLRIFPESRKGYETWLKEMKTTYLELFLRVFVIFFMIQLIILIPQLIDYLFGGSADVDGFMMVPLATALLIWGMLDFAKEAPDLFKKMFDFGGELFKGISIDPRMSKQLENSGAYNMMKGAVYGATTGAAQGALTGPGGAFMGAVGGMFRGGAEGYGHGYAEGRRRLDQFRDDEAAGSTFRGRTIDRLRQSVGMETRQEAMDRDIKLHSTIEAKDEMGTKRQYSQEDYKARREYVQSLNSAQKSIRDSIGHAIDKDDSKIQLAIVDSAGLTHKGNASELAKKIASLEAAAPTRDDFTTETTIKNSDGTSSVVKNFDEDAYNKAMKAHLDNIQKMNESLRNQKDAKKKAIIDDIVISGKDSTADGSVNVSDIGNADLSNAKASLDEINSTLSSHAYGTKDASGNVVKTSKIDSINELDSMRDLSNDELHSLTAGKAKTDQYAQGIHESERYQHSAADNRQVHQNPPGGGGKK